MMNEYIAGVILPCLAHAGNNLSQIQRISFASLRKQPSRIVFNKPPVTDLNTALSSPPNMVIRFQTLRVETQEDYEALLIFFFHGSSRGNPGYHVHILQPSLLGGRPRSSRRRPSRSGSPATDPRVRAPQVPWVRPLQNSAATAPQDPTGWYTKHSVKSQMRLAQSRLCIEEEMSVL
uniref:Uncharacterized protein n=1 Tax=Aegilops tauschii TaxID=37682 RepID=M8C3T4_AEGTA